MNKKERLHTINNELKSYINESSFISVKCRNKLLKIFSIEFNVDLDIRNYQNVDLKINDDFTFTYRDDKYKSNDNINTLSYLEAKYERFKDKADELLDRKKINFESKSRFNNITNLIFVICLILLLGILLCMAIMALFKKKYVDGLGYILFWIPLIIPRFKYALMDRIIQARDYVRELIRTRK